MRIVLASTEAPCHGPGEAGLTCTLRAGALAMAGHEVHVLTTACADTSAFAPPYGVRFHYLDAPPASNSQAFADRCAESCQRLAPDLVHLEGLEVAPSPWWRPWAGRTVATLYGTIVTDYLDSLKVDRVFRRRSRWIDRSAWRLEQWLLRELRRIIVPDRWCQAALAEHYSRDSAVVAPPLDDAFLDADIKPVPQESPVLCGDGDSWEVLQRAASGAGLMVGPIRRTERRKILKQLDGCAAIVAGPARGWGLPLEVREAMARGRCVAAPHGGSVSELASRFPRAIHAFHLDDPASVLEAVRNAVAGAADAAWPSRLAAYPAAHAGEWLAACL